MWGRRGRRGWLGGSAGLRGRRWGFFRRWRVSGLGLGFGGCLLGGRVGVSGVGWGGKGVGTVFGCVADGC